MNKENLYTPGCIRTFSGHYINPMEPEVDKIELQDIAHALSHQCRFGGHLPRFYSVAEHCTWMAAIAPHDHKLATLLHDASEAYLLDLPKPIKSQLPGYEEAEDRLMRVIADKFGFEYPLHPIVKALDKEALEFEWAFKMLQKSEHKMEPGWVRGVFIRMFNDIKN